MNHEGSFKTNDKGELLMYSRDAFYDYFRQNPSSTFTFKIQKTSNNSSKRLDAFFYAEVIPKLIKGFRDTGDNHNKLSMLQEIKKYSPVMWDGNECREWDELNYFEKHKCIEELIIFAAENLQIVIENPK